MMALKKKREGKGKGKWSVKEEDENEGSCAPGRLKVTLHWFPVLTDVV